jgi:hypothetical protein
MLVFFHFRKIYYLKSVLQLILIFDIFIINIKTCFNPPNHYNEVFDMEKETSAPRRIVLITGASSGFGRACALHLGQSAVSSLRDNPLCEF